MTAQTSIPLKWYVPFANGDSSRVELPVTTADPTRASQTLGFPPLTMQPPESGGVPPQGEDFNGGMNQVARICWWILNGGGWPYDSTFATNSNINGYPNGAKLQAADFKGDWISIADNNQNNPDTVGTGWVPGFQYGTTAVTGLTGGTTTLTPAQAAKGSITLAGTLGSAQTIVLPTWTKNWTITNNTTGAFVTIVKTAAGSGVTIPQNASPTRVSGDGANITQAPENVAAATQSTNPAQLGQIFGHQQFFTANGSFTVPAGVTQIFLTGAGGGGGGGGGGGNSSTGASGGGGGGGSGDWVYKQPVTVAPGQILTITIGANGTGGAAGSAAGGNGGNGTAGTATTITGSAPTVSVTLAGGALGTGGTGNTGAGNTGGGTGGTGGGTNGNNGAPGSTGATAGGALAGFGGPGGGTVFGPGGQVQATASGSAGGAGKCFGAAGGGGSGAVTGGLNGGIGGAGKSGAVLLEW